MPDFHKTSLQGRLTYIGVVKNRADDLKSEPLRASELTLDGIAGEDHGGRVRPSCSRVSMLYEKGTEIANARQLCIMSDEELLQIAEEAGLPENRAEWWGASLALSGIPALSALPPSTRLRFPSGATIRVDVENGPCSFTAREVSAQTDGDAPAIKAAAKFRRGLVGSVERVGEIKLGDPVEVFFAQARPYPHSVSG